MDKSGRQVSQCLMRTLLIVVVILFGLAGTIGQSVAMIQGGGWLERGAAGLFLLAIVAFGGLITCACNFHPAQASQRSLKSP